MNCPNCGDKMEREDCPMVEGSSLEWLRKTGQPTIAISAAHYYCDGCDSEWSWIKGVKGLLFIDGARGLDEARRERILLPIDSHSQLDTGFTGRSDLDGRMQNERHKPKRGFLA